MQAWHASHTLRSSWLHWSVWRKPTVWQWKKWSLPMRVDAVSKFRPESRVQSKYSIQCPSPWLVLWQMQVPWHSLLCHKLGSRQSARQGLSNESNWRESPFITSHATSSPKELCGTKFAGNYLYTRNAASVSTVSTLTGRFWCPGASDQKNVSFFLLSALLSPCWHMAWLKAQSPVHQFWCQKRQGLDSFYKVWWITL